MHQGDAVFHASDPEVSRRKHNTYRDGMVHVLSEKCATCIFNPATRFVPGSSVAALVSETKDVPGSAVICHSTLGQNGKKEHAICSGWWDRFASRDAILTLARNMGIIKYVELLKQTGQHGGST